MRLYYRDGLRQREIAARLGIRQPNVSRLIRRAKGSLKRSGIDFAAMNVERIEELVVVAGLHDG